MATASTVRCRSLIQNPHAFQEYAEPEVGQTIDLLAQHWPDGRVLFW